ncbi:hypothetical protein DT076_08025 [Desertihabitans brevis]|uniref:DUF3558 domain-containing protein n=1 Tax=Desertihabitans brevis TaxID=2268447 RepID=A0A367YVX2_9ACTN|nr:hypothetical protein [Desertihabitans brevis]RCK69950.1 hypothetical protein DT076_08025 [Desertihabitans brevis]
MRRRLAALAVLPLLASVAACSQQPPTSGEPPAEGPGTPSASPAVPSQEELQAQLLTADLLPTEGWSEAASAKPVIPIDSGDPCTGDPTALDQAATAGSAPAPIASAAFTRSYERSDSGPKEDTETVIEILGFAPGVAEVVAQQREAWSGCTGEPVDLGPYQPDVSAEPVEVEAGVSAPACVRVVQGAGGATAVEYFGHYCLVELSGERVLSLYVEAATDPAEETPDGERPTLAPEVEENFRSYLDAAVTAAG